jgi:hypothetical protein
VNAGDYAIVVGIARYPELGEAGAALDLKGSEHDVDAVVAWLTDPAGGHLPPPARSPDARPVPNVQVIKSSAFTAPTSAEDAEPTIVKLEGALENLDRVAQANKAAGKGQRVGRRLYIYMSGHGFSTPPTPASGPGTTSTSRAGWRGCKTRATSASSCCGWTAA